MASPIICDIGTSCARVGRAGEAVPDFYQLRTTTSPCPVWSSRVYDFDAYYDKLKESKLFAKSSEVPAVMVIESVSEPDSISFKRRLCEIVLETQQVQAINFQYSPVVSCFANARQSGLVLDMSGGGCTATAVLDGWCLQHTNMERSELGGEKLDEWLSKTSNGPSLSKEAFNALKKRRTERESQTYKLPDSTPVHEKVTDVLFDPSHFNNPVNYIPLPELVFTAATKQTSNEVRRALLNNIVLCGGLSRTDGLAFRLASELNAMARMDNPRIIACGPQQRDVIPWIGGSILACLPVFKDLCLSKTEYDEAGMDKKGEEQTKSGDKKVDAIQRRFA